MPALHISQNVNDFIVLPLASLSTATLPIDTTHYLYIRANAPRIPTDDTPREVFLVNLPIDATEHHLRSLFAHQLGGARIERVAFEDARTTRGITAPIVKRKRKRGNDEVQLGRDVGVLPSVWNRELHQSGSTAIVTFVDQASAELALREARRAVKNDTRIVWGAGIAEKLRSLGEARYLEHHRLRYPPHDKLQASVDAYMTAFAVAESDRAKALARQRSEPDEDGFITVVRGGRNGPAREEEAKAKEEELKQREKDRVKPDFYRFQVREKRKEEAQKLVQDFEQDREKVEAIRRRKGKTRPQ